MAPNLAPGVTLFYNVYTVYFKQANSPPHQGIALVPAQIQGQDRGRYYHVKGLAGMGMEYECRPAYGFGLYEEFQGKIYQFQLPKANLPKFENIASTHPPPHDPRAFTEKNADPPIRDCGAWVEEVLDAAKTLARTESLSA